jgi:hypothetical protein
MYALPVLLTKFFANKGKKLKFVLMYSLIIGVLDMIIPLIATLFTDPLCFNHLIVSSPESTLTYSIQKCASFDLLDFVFLQRFVINQGYFNPFCSSVYVHENKLNFTPIPVYSGQCRNALFQNFLPIVMYSSVLMTIYRLSSYLYRLSRDEINVKLSLPDLIYSLCALFEDVALFVVYGTIHPLVATALSINILTHLNILKATVSRLSREDSEYVDMKCQEALKFTSYVIWPPLIICSILYGYIIF